MSKIKCTLACEIEIKPVPPAGYYAACPKHHNSARVMPTRAEARQEWQRWLEIDGKVKEGER
jgi:hypothetical protein